MFTILYPEFSQNKKIDSANLLLNPYVQNDPGEIVVDTDPALLQELAEQPTGMQTTDLRSMKDQLLIETTEMLGVSLVVIEPLYFI